MPAEAHTHPIQMPGTQAALDSGPPANQNAACVTGMSVPPLVWILMLSLAVRLVLLVWFRTDVPRPGDEQEYHQLALSLTHSGQWVLDGQPCSMRPPLYPAVVAGIYKLFGPGNYSAVRAFQALAGLVTVCVVYLLGTELYDRRVGLWAAGLYAFYPSMLAQANLLMSETLFAFWMALVCLVAIRSRRQAAIGHAALAGVLLGLGALTRSVAWLLAPGLALWLVLGWKGRWPGRLAAASLMLATVAATLAPWSVRCSRLEKTLVVVDVMGGRNLMMGNYEHTPLYRAWDAIRLDGQQAWYRVLAARHPGFRELTQGQRDQLAGQYALHFMARHPVLTLQRSLVKFANFWQLERETLARLASGPARLPTALVILLSLVIVGYYAATMLTGIFGAVLTPPDDRWGHGLILLVIGLVCAVHTLVFGHSRYHLPLAPLISIYAAAAVTRLPTIRSWCRRPGCWVAGLLSLALVASWVWQAVAFDLGQYIEAFWRLGR